MGTSIDEQLCVCGDPGCVGCDCGMDCAFSPGHALGTDAIAPLAAMIEATERFLAEDMTQGNEGRSMLSPGLRRLRATLAFAKRNLAPMRSLKGG